MMFVQYVEKDTYIKSYDSNNNLRDRRKLASQYDEQYILFHFSILGWSTRRVMSLHLYNNRLRFNYLEVTSSTETSYSDKDVTDDDIEKIFIEHKIFSESIERLRQSIIVGKFLVSKKKLLSELTDEDKTYLMLRFI